MQEPPFGGGRRLFAKEKAAPSGAAQFKGDSDEAQL